MSVPFPDLVNLQPASSPNWHFACPPDWQVRHCREASPVFAVGPDELAAAVMRLAADQPRVDLVMADDALRQYRFAVRSRVFRFVDDVFVQIVEMSEGRSSLAIYSAARAGQWDLGVNRRRIRHWLRLLRAGVALAS